MWQTISNISAIVTCVAFLLYLAGHIWAVLKNRDTLYEKFSVLPYDPDSAIEDEDNVFLVDDTGCEFTLESDYGIDTVTVYKVDCNVNADGKFIIKNRTFRGSYKGLRRERLFVRCDLGEVMPTTQLEIKRTDYTIITFLIFESGKNGHILTDNYKFKLTFKGFLYHLCV